MARSGSQKVLFVLSIINIVIAVLGILAAYLTITRGAMLSGVDLGDATAPLKNLGINQGEGGAFVSIMGIVILLASVLELVTGVLGIRAANDSQKIMPVWVLAIIGIIISFVGAIIVVVSGELANNTSLIASLIMGALMLWIANNIKVQAGK